MPLADSGSVGGYMDMVQAMRQPWTDEYVDWLGAPYDADLFDKDQVNEMLTGEDFGCPWYD